MELILEQMPIVLPALNAGFLQTLKLFIVTLAGSLPLGLIIAFGAMSKFKPLSLLTKLVIWIIRGTPLMIQLLIIYYFPGLVLDNPIWGSGEKGRFLAAAVAFIFNYACYFAEIYRAGISAVPVGQYEAAKLLGYSKSQTFIYIVLPQVVKHILPPVANETITLVKDTSLARVIGVHEIIMEAENYSRVGIIWPLFYTGVFFLLFNGILTLLFGYIEKKLDYYKNGVKIYENYNG